MNYKVIFLDVDGTLFDHVNGKVPESAIKAVKLARAKGIKIVLSTGRSMSLIKQLGVDKLVEADAYITCNGAITYNQAEKIIDAFPFKRNQIMELIYQLHSKKLRMLIVPKGVNYLNLELTNEAKGAFDDLRIGYPLVKKIKDEEIYQLVLFANPVQANKVSPLLKDLTFKQFHPHAYDIFAPGVNKGSAIKNYLKNNGYTKAEAVGLGDGHNDVEMMASVKYSVAMGNAVDEIKKIAKFVTTSVNEDGLYNAFKELKIIE
jgi:Cof subfamily protein (haloacid dehalogenase superfamily)